MRNALLDLFARSFGRLAARNRRMALALALLAPVAAFAQDDPQLIAQSRVPDDVRCLVLNVVGSRTVRRTFDVTPGQEALFTVKGLPFGAVTVTEDAFGTPCAGLAPNAVAAWSSEPVAATLARGTSVQLTLNLFRNGQAVIRSRFVEEGTAPPPPPVALASCTAQRTVHLVGGNGGLAWFTLVWPAPAVITGFNPNFAFDDPARAVAVTTSAEHPLFVRRVAGRAVWDGIGARPQVTAFVAGTNQTHTSSPSTTRLAGGITGSGVDVIAAGAALQSNAQSGVNAALPVLSFRAGLVYGPAPGAPAAVTVTDIDGAITALRAVTPISPEVEQELRPSPVKLASWGIDAGTPNSLATLARTLLFTANAFKRGLVSTVLMPAFNDDPHGAFNSADAAARADGLARVLDGFYAELATSTEPRCSNAGRPLSLADNVVLLVSGDTFKNSFNRAGWPDGTPGNSNLLFVRSNGFLKPGWFGAITPGVRTNFDPATGAASATANLNASTAAAQLGILFAIARGNTAAVAQASNAPFGGVIETTLP